MRSQRLHPGGGSTARTLRTRIGVFFILGVFAIFGAAPGIAAEDQEPSIEKVGEIPVLYPGGYPSTNFPKDSGDVLNKVAIVLNPARRRAYELFRLDNPARLAIRAVDLDTFKPLGPGKAGTPGYAEILGFPAMANSGGTPQADFTHALDDQAGALFVSTSTSASFPNSGTVHSIHRIDLQRFDRGEEESFSSVDALATPAALVFHRNRLGEGKVVTLEGSSIRQLDAATLAEDWGEQVPPQCPSLKSPDGEPALWRSSAGNYLYMVCTDANGNQSRIVRVVVDPMTKDRPTSVVQVFPGPLDYLVVATADPAIDRVTMITHESTAKGTTAWVFDGRGEALVGTAAFLPQNNGAEWAYGIDETTGRFYGYSSDYISAGESKKSARRGGLFIFDNRLTPITQALQFPELAYAAAGRIGTYAAKGGQRRFVVRRGSPTSPGYSCYKYPSTQRQNDTTAMGGCNPDHFFTVYADRIPIPRQPVPSDLDSNTQGVPEASGKTERTFEASGGAFGVRARLVGGLRGGAHDVLNDRLYYDGGKTDIVNFGSFDTNTLHQPGRYPAPACWAADREAITAQVEDAVVSEHEASATARFLQADPATKEDQRAPATRCRPLITPYELPPPNMNLDHLATAETPPYGIIDRRTGSEWTFEDASCSGNQDQRVQAQTLREVPQEVNETVEAGGQSQPLNPTPTKTEDPHDLAAPAPPPGLGARTTCDHEHDAAKAGAEATPVQVGVAGELTVAESTADVDVARIEGGGVKVTSVAEVKGIRIGEVSIQAVRSVATSIAKGRPGTATTTFTRTICGVVLDKDTAPSPCYTATQAPACLASVDLPPSEKVFGSDFTRPEPRQAYSQAREASRTPRQLCADPLQGLITQINAQLAGNAEIIMRQPEPALAKGTPGGYLAGVQKKEAQVVNDSLFLRDYTREIPGLEITTYKDSQKFGVGRQIIQLAGVRATTSYGTLCLPPLAPQGGECKEGSFGFEEGPAIGGVIPEPVTPAPLPEAPVPDAPVQDTPSLDPQGSTSGLPQIPQAPPTPVSKARAFLVRSFSEGILGTGIWFALGLPVYLATRRFSLTRAFPKT